MKSNKQTSVEWLVEQVEDFIFIGLIPVDIIEQAKEMEKEQISDAWENGFMSTGQGWNGEVTPEMHNETLDTEQYYEQTYGGKDE
jgi:hypothetical protein